MIQLKIIKTMQEEYNPDKFAICGQVKTLDDNEISIVKSGCTGEVMILFYLKTNTSPRSLLLNLEQTIELKAALEKFIELSTTSTEDEEYEEPDIYRLKEDCNSWYH